MGTPTLPQALKTPISTLPQSFTLDPWMGTPTLPWAPGHCFPLLSFSFSAVTVPQRGRWLAPGHAATKKAGLTKARLERLQVCLSY